MYYTTTKDDLAKIAIAKNLIREYKNSNSERTVYLNDKTEFQIYIKNPYPSHTGVKISVNGKSIGNMLVLRPGQSFWLDRFVNENRKFLFSTYEIEDSPEMNYATQNNGKVTVQFFHEKEKNDYTLSVSVNNGPTIYPSSYTSTWDYSGSRSNVRGLSDVKLCNNSEINHTYLNQVNSVNTVLSSCVDTLDCTNFSATTASNSRSKDFIEGISGDIGDIDRSAMKRLKKQGTKETGRVEKGGRSNQEFECCDLDFEYWPFKTENIQILPNSQKQVRVEETRRKYCSQCGKKVSPKDKFCSNCGARLD